MALVSATLASGLAGVFAAKLPAVPQVAQQMAAAYTSYASAGMVGVGTVVISPANTAAMQNAFLAALSIPAGTPVSFANAWALGLTAFWMSPPVAIVGAQSGVVTVPPAAPVVIPLITAAVSNLASTPQITANLIAAAAHAAVFGIVQGLVTNLVPIPPTIVLPLL